VHQSNLLKNGCSLTTEFLGYILQHQLDSGGNGMNAEQKFRPYFTASELSYLIDSCKLRTPINQSLLRYLEGFAIKIERGVSSPAYISNPPATIDQRLGFSPPTVLEPTIHPAQLPAMNQLYENSVDRCKLSPAQIEAVQVYRYTNDLMEPAEEMEYEISLRTEIRT
jgi:hypothetical protein